MDPVMAAGEILLTQVKAQQGGVTNGDAPGFPITINAPGSFQLASNLQPPAGKAAIQIRTRDVTIDLNGFRVRGSGTATFGVIGNAANVTIKNGTIFGFKFDGINGVGANWIIEDMRVVGNQRDGISCTQFCQIEGSVVTTNGRQGIAMVTGTVLGNTIFNNGGVGLFSAGWAGYGNNTLQGNVGGQVAGGIQRLQPNACNPTCPP